MIFPFSFRNGYGKDLWPRPWTIVVVVVVVVIIVVVEETGETEFFPIATSSPKILSIEKLNGGDLLVFVVVDCFWETSFERHGQIKYQRREKSFT